MTSLAELFEAQADAAPEATAVSAGAERLTYAQLDLAAGELADRLRAAGVGAGRSVAVALPPSPGLITALLAVVKAGAAYLPVDPGYPPERIAFMLDDARPACVITSAEVAARLPADSRPDPPAAGRFADGLTVWCGRAATRAGTLGLWR